MRLAEKLDWKRLTLDLFKICGFYRGVIEGAGLLGCDARTWMNIS
jgi:hypothetical protein